MSEKGVAADALARHLHAAIERVREDVAKVEFWADAVTGFSQPVPDYDTKDVKVWLPPEQATSDFIGQAGQAQKAIRRSQAADDAHAQAPL